MPGHPERHDEVFRGEDGAGESRARGVSAIAMRPVHPEDTLRGEGGQDIGA